MITEIEKDTIIELIMGKQIKILEAKEKKKLLEKEADKQLKELTQLIVKVKDL